jgi:hypothetical protein
MAPALRSVAVAILSLVLLSACAGRRQLIAPTPNGPSILPQSAESAHGREPAERVKNAIKSLGRQLKGRSVQSPKALAGLQPIPLISASSPVRAVGTSGVWSVVETTHDTPAKPEAVSQTQTQFAKSRPTDRKSSAPWVLVGIGAAVLVGAIAARRQSARTRIEH